MKVGLRREDALCCSKWSVGANQIEVNLATFTCWGYYQISDIGVSSVNGWWCTRRLSLIYN